MYDSIYIRYLEIVQIIKTESRMVVVGCRVGGMEEYCLKGIAFQFYKMKSYRFGCTIL